MAIFCIYNQVLFYNIKINFTRWYHILAGEIKLKKIAVIQDLSGLGKCSLTAAIPVISVMGVQAVPLLTAVLSNQTGYPSYYALDYTEHMEKVMDEWEKLDFAPEGIYTGFLANEIQADKILDFFRRFRKPDTMVLVDPVMGDNGRAFGIYTEAFRAKMLQLISCARVITPNLTEALLLLYGQSDLEEKYAALMALTGAKRLEQIEKIGAELVGHFHLQAAVITGVEYEADSQSQIQMGNLVAENGQTSWCFAEKKGGSYSGTGDLFASVLSAGLVQGISMMDCVKMAVDFLSGAISETVKEGTDRNDGVCFEKYLGELCKKK